MHALLRSTVVAAALSVAGLAGGIASAAPAAPLALPGTVAVDALTVPVASSLAASISAPAGQTPEQSAVTYADSKVGAPSVWGASGPDAFDGPGLMQWAYQKAGVRIPRTTEAQDQDEVGKPVTLDALQPGDLVFFYNSSHVGMYVGDGNVIHAPDTGDQVVITAVRAMPADGARHIIY